MWKMNALEQVMSWGSIAIGLAAAWLWLRASTVVVRKGDPESKGGFFLGSHDPPIDVYSTVSEASELTNRRPSQRHCQFFCKHLPPLLESSPEERTRALNPRALSSLAPLPCGVAGDPLRVAWGRRSHPTAGGTTSLLKRVAENPEKLRHNGGLRRSSV